MTTPTTAGGAVLPAFESPAVQTVYEVLCDGAIPPDNEHWEGFVACRIVSALTTHAPARAAIDALSAELAKTAEALKVARADRDCYIERFTALRAAQDDQARAVVAAGALMANTMFNLSQHPGRVLTDAECVTFKQMQVKWDAAIAATKCDALRSALMSNAAPEVDRSAERVETARRIALEEAAKLCEDGWHLLTRHECAAAIRALADPLQGKETPR